MNRTNLDAATPPAGDELSSKCVGVLTARPGEAYCDLVAPPRGPADAERLLAGVTPAQLLAVPVRDVEAADAMLAGLWLWHDALDRSHAISQAIASETGSFWHAIMHRREGDFSNAKYWYARCRRHPVLGVIRARGGRAAVRAGPAGDGPGGPRRVGRARRSSTSSRTSTRTRPPRGTPPSSACNDSSARAVRPRAPASPPAGRGERARQRRRSRSRFSANPINPTSPVSP